jgi:hypothetical protein
VTVHCRTDLLAGEFALDRQRRYIESEKGKHVAVDDLVVPWRAGTIVAVVVAAHVIVAGKPVGVVVDSLACVVGRVRSGLAAWRDIVGKLALPDLAQTGRQIEQHPVEEIDARQRGRHCPVFLVDVVAPARHIRIVADEDERPGFGGDIAPRQARVAIAAEADMVLRVRGTKGKLTRDRLPITETAAGQYHRSSSRLI